MRVVFFLCVRFPKFDDFLYISIKHSSVMQVRHQFYSKFAIAGLGYYQIERVKDELQVGTELHLLREPRNPSDSKAVAVYYKGYMLGHIPNRPFNINFKYARLLDESLTELFYVTVSSFDFRSSNPFNWTVEVNVMLRLDGAVYYSLTKEEEQMVEDILDADLSGILAAFSKYKTLRTMLHRKKVDVSFTAKWETDDLNAFYDPKHEAVPLTTKNDQEKDVIGQYFTSYNGADTGKDPRIVDYPLICVYLNRIDRLAMGNHDVRKKMISSTLIHECMHALFDHDPDTLTHPHDSYLEEPTCECGTIMIAEVMDALYPGFGNWVFNSVDGKKDKYGLGADLHMLWPCRQERASNAVDAYNEACDHIIMETDKFVNWNGRMAPGVAIPEMQQLYSMAASNKHAGLSNRRDK